MVKAETCLLHRVGDGHGLEVATVVNDPRFTVDQRIVGCCEYLINHIERRGMELT